VQKGIKNPLPRPDDGYGNLLIQEQDLKDGGLNTALARFGTANYVSETLAVWPHDLVIRTTASGYRALVVDVHAHFPCRRLYCAAPLFGIFVKPLDSRQPLLLPGYLAWWLNQLQAPCAQPEALIKSCIPLPPLALQRQLLTALSLVPG
jgi:hypothetical protein